LWNLPVAEGDQEDAARPADAGDLGQNLDRAGEVLDRDGDGDGVERGVGVGQRRVGVEVVDHAVVEARVAGELGGVHAEAGDAAERGPFGRGQVRHP